MALRQTQSVAGRMLPWLRLRCMSSLPEIQIANSLAPKAKELQPLLPPNSSSAACPQPSTLSWYACGPTVYDDAHLGHARTYVCHDILRRIVSHMWAVPTTFCMGLTDVDDKIIAKAAESNVDPAALAAHFEARFFEDMTALGVHPPDMVVRVTEHMQGIVDYIQGILENGMAYETPDGVWFDTKAFGPLYGCCFRVRPGSEVAEPDPAATGGAHKRSAADFALWKAAKPGEPTWESPWGAGRPGWHIECSAMTHSVFGTSLDLHSGGVDLMFPHHANEVAQCEAHNQPQHSHAAVDDAHGYSSTWVRRFIHTGHLHIDGRKMSKSLKNFITVRQLLQSYPADVFRMFCLQHRYSANVMYSEVALVNASRLLDRFVGFFSAVERLRAQHERANAAETFDVQSRPQQWVRPQDAAMVESANQLRWQVAEALACDFDTPRALEHMTAAVTAGHAYMQEGSPRVHAVQKVARYLYRTLQQLGFGSLGQGAATSSGGSGGDNTAVDELVAFRDAVRKAALEGRTQDILAECSRVRDEVLPALGAVIADTDVGTGVSARKSIDIDDDEIARREAQRAANQARAAELAKIESIPPEDWFRRQSEVYSAFDDEGVPTHDAAGEPLSKKGRKKLRKELMKHAKLHANYKQRSKQGTDEPTSSS